VDESTLGFKDDQGARWHCNDMLLFAQSLAKERSPDFQKFFPKLSAGIEEELRSVDQSVLLTDPGDQNKVHVIPTTFSEEA
jgi:hypothetical protein